ncbi:MAG: DUF4215 domain-containing protein [Myxococcales bacterium]|nr:DUF4215 domain-containing protein [Myxococcales bacterium]MCB9651296.1 DUF4215 domain-containing protein [Deltaproteobacteria bacterium]
MVSPVIAVGDATSVRLQYRRWLTVEDGLADQAEILVGGRRAWTNARGNGDLHHLDKEWRFHDVDITTAVQRDDGQAQVSFRLTSNGEVSFGGWTVDDFCIVAWDGPVAACGDGKMDFGEACDDGNDVSGDGCEADCSVTRVPACGDGIVDPGEQCDDGNQVAGDGCEATCVSSINGLNPEVSGCGCTAAETSGARASSAVLVLGLALILLARRRFC